MVVSFHSTPFNYVESGNQGKDTFRFLFIHTQPGLCLRVLKVNPWWPSVLSVCIQCSSWCQTGMAVRYNSQSHAECVFKSLDLECGSCQRNEGHHKRLLGLKGVWERDRQTQWQDVIQKQNCTSPVTLMSISIFTNTFVMNDFLYHSLISCSLEYFYFG